MPINLVKYGNTTLIDLTGDTVTVNDVVSGVTFHLRDGSTGTGSIVNGNNLAYGLTDGTLPLVGVAKVGYAEVE